MLTSEQCRSYEKFCVGAVAELVDAPDLGSDGETRESSSLSRPTRVHRAAYLGDRTSSEVESTVRVWRSMNSSPL